MSAPVICGAGYAGELRGAGFAPVPAGECTPGMLEPGAVVVLDGLTTEETALLEELLAAGGRACIAVLARRWDGFEPVPLASACRGIISGFGMAGITAAARELEPLS